MPNGLALAINILIVLALISYIVLMILNFFYSTRRRELDGCHMISSPPDVGNVLPR